jgi:hypothetical protein
MSSERRKVVKGKSPSKSSSSSSSSSSAAASSSANLSEAELNAELAGYADYFEELNAKKAKKVETEFEKILATLEKTSKEVASLSAAAKRSPSPKSFAKIEAQLAAASAAAADLTLISQVRAKLESDYLLAGTIIEDVLHLPPSARCGLVTSFLTDIHARVLKVSGASGKYAAGTTRKLLNLFDASKHTSCAHHRTDKEFLSYLINVMETLFDEGFFNEGTIDRSGKHQLEALYNHFWNETTKSSMGKAFVKRGGSRTKKRRRLNRSRSRKISVHRS